MNIYVLLMRVPGAFKLLHKVLLLLICSVQYQQDTYAHSKFKFGHSYSGLEPYGVLDIVMSVPCMTKTPQCILSYRNGVVCCIENRKAIALIFGKIYRFDLDAIYINPQE